MAGYFGYGNAGDELIRRTLLQNLRNVSWTVLSGSADRWNPLFLAKIFRRCQALILGGGDLFQVRTSRRSLLYYLVLILWARLWGCRVYAYGVGLDPTLPAWARWMVGKVLAQTQGLWARDERSADIFRQVGLSPSLVPDSVWAWPVAPAPWPSSKKRVLWILRFADDASKKVHRWTDRLNGLAQSNREQGFLALHPREDMASLAHLRAGLRFFHRLELWDQLDQIPEIMKRYDVVVSLRFHGIVGAVLAHRPCVAVADHEKVSVLARTLGIPSFSGDVDAPVLENALAQAWAMDERILAARREQLQKEAQAGLASLERFFVS